MPISKYSNGVVEYKPPAFHGRYPRWHMPEEVNGAVTEASFNFKIPFEVCAHAALEVMSLICSLFIKVRVAPYEPALVALYLMLIVKSGGGKSVGPKLFQRPIHAFERKLNDQYETALGNYKAELKMWEEDGRRLNKQYREAPADSAEAADVRGKCLQHETKRPVAPTKPVLRFSSVRPEALRDALVANHSILISNPDAGHVINGYTLSQPTVLCGYWSADDVSVGMVSGNRRLGEPAVTMSYMTQERYFTKYMSTRGEEAFGSGLWARNLVAQVNDDENSEPTAIAEVDQPQMILFNKLSELLLEQDIPEPANRQILELSADAALYAQLFKTWVQRHRIQGDFSEELKSFFRKIVQQATRIAAIFHYFCRRNGDISGESMQSAIGLCEWYMDEFIRIFANHAPSPQQMAEAAAQELLEWLEKATSEPWRYRNLKLGEYKERDLRNHAIRDNVEKLRVAIKVLEWRGLITVGATLRGATVIYFPARPPHQIPSFAYSPIAYPNNVRFGQNSTVNMQTPQSSQQQFQTDYAAQYMRSMTELGHLDAQPVEQDETLMEQIQRVTNALPK